ncbi:MAG: radical SAM protein [Armatimonadota bacterium]
MIQRCPGQRVPTRSDQTAQEMAQLQQADLHSYRSIAMGEKSPAYLNSRHLLLGEVNIAGMSDNALWELHDRNKCNFDASIDGPSLLDLKIEIADRILGACNLCERRCGADRTNGEVGFCGVGDVSHYFFEQILWGEEEPLIPSHEIFFSGCNMRCKTCYSWEAIMNPATGRRITPESLAGMVDLRRSEGAVNVNLIGGEPTVHISNILRSLKVISNPTAVVWNSNFYMSEEAMKLLDGIVDLYVGDFRFGNDDCASRISDTAGYFGTAARNFLLAAESGDLIIRHLLLPGHIECCLRPVAEWVARHLPSVPFNLMFQYTPCAEALDDPLLYRTITAEEEGRAHEIVSSLGLNTTAWRVPLDVNGCKAYSGSGEVSTEISIRPDGRVVIMHVHGELLSIIKALESGGCTDVDTR